MDCFLSVGLYRGRMSGRIRQSALRFPLDEIFGSAGKVRVLRDLRRHGGYLSASTIVRRTALAKRTVQLALNALEEMEIVLTAGSPRTRLYRLNANHPLAPSIAAVFEAEDSRFETIIAAIRKAAARKGVLAVWLYGSVARGEDGPESDVDIAIYADAGAAAEIERAVLDKLLLGGEQLLFRPSLSVLDERDVLRLAHSGDPWWRDVCRDALVIKGPPPDVAASALMRAAGRGSAA